MKLVAKSQEKLSRKKGLQVTIAVHAVALALFMYPMMHFNESSEDTTVALNEIPQGITIDYSKKQPLVNEGQSAPRLQKMAGEKMPVPPAPALYNPKQETAPRNQAAASPVVEAKPVVTADNKEVSVGANVPVSKTKPLLPAINYAPVSDKPQVDPRSLYHGVTGGKDTKPAPNADPRSGNGGSDGRNNPGVVNGSGGTGTTEGLKGRHAVYRPNVLEMNQKEGVVSVKISVNRQGKVTDAVYSVKGSNTADSDLIAKALAYAKQYKYEASDLAPETQIGNITFVFKLHK